MALKRYTVIDPNGEEHKCLAQSKHEALMKFANKAGIKKEEYRKLAEVYNGWYGTFGGVF